MNEHMDYSALIEKKEYNDIGETVYTANLPNGLRVYVLEKPQFNSAYAALAVNYGGMHRAFVLDGESKSTPAGVAHFLEHKMFDLPGGDNALEMLTANGADPNAFTSASMTAYHFSCTEKFEDNLRLLIHFVTTPYFTDETVEKEQGIIAQEICMGEDNPGVRLYYNLLSQLYKEHPIRDRVAGTVESISHITAETLYDCHRAFYVPGNMCLCVEGNVKAGRVVEIAMEELGSDKASAASALLSPEAGEAPCESVRREAMPVSAPQFFIGARFTPAETQWGRLYERLVAQMSMRMLAGASSPFYTRLYAQGLLNRDFDYEVDFAGNTATIIIGGESQQPERVLEEFCAELERVKTQGFDKGSFELAKRASLGARLRGLEDFENVCIALAEGEFDAYDPLEAIGLLGELREEDCGLFVRRVLKSENLALSVIEPGKEGA